MLRLHDADVQPPRNGYAHDPERGPRKRALASCRAASKGWRDHIRDGLPVVRPQTWTHAVESQSTAAADVTEYYADVRRAFPRVRRMIVLEDELPPAFCLELSRFDHLTDLSINSFSRPWAPDLRGLPSLTRLSLDSLDPEDGATPRVPEGLRHLKLKSCDWADAAWFRANPTPLLETLALRRCVIEPGTGPLRTICAQSPLLSALDLQACDDEWEFALEET
jgi:hypothetical protein